MVHARRHGVTVDKGESRFWVNGIRKGVEVKKGPPTVCKVGPLEGGAVQWGRGGQPKPMNSPPTSRVRRVTQRCGAVSDQGGGEPRHPLDEEQPMVEVDSKSYMMRKEFFKEFVERLEITPTFDCFADENTAQCAGYFTNEQNALMQKWDPNEICGLTPRGNCGNKQPKELWNRRARQFACLRSGTKGGCES